ncbi:MAG: HU family DNA-binding protein, partial [Prevotella sp.]|nr:HU family DNA-binding protein [Prevotella sp.]
MGKVTIQELSKILVEKNGLSQRDASKFGTTMFALILEYLERGEQVKVKGLGTFRIINVEARESVSVRTGERVVIESHSKVSFTPDATMKELVNKPFSQFETVVLNDGVEFNDIREQPEQEEDVDTDVDEVADVVDTEVDVPQEETPV